MTENDDDERAELARAARDGDVDAARRLVRLLERTSGRTPTANHAARIVDLLSEAVSNASERQADRARGLPMASFHPEFANSVLLVGDEDDRRAALSEAAASPALSRVIWLENLGTEGRKTTDGLKTAVMVRATAALGAKAGAGRGWERGRRDFDALRNAMHDVGIGLEGNLHARKGALDPESYAVEVEHASRAAIGLPQRIDEAFATALEAVGASVMALPVQDLEYQLESIDALLSLPRTFRSPRIVFLYGCSPAVAELVERRGSRTLGGRVVVLE